MTRPIISVENIGKMYRIGQLQEAYQTFGETLVKGLTAPFKRAARLMRGQAGGAADLVKEFWALKDVSFTVEPGEVVGIIGRNGAGKTTLLKILSRITTPTEGRATLSGRVGSLLEVGTGFHPELTGRENVFLNGAILGMSKAEIERKFDEIVAFAEVEKFIDTPVKHYSSGMQVRLAFAVAAHLEPEIMMVDEVLAVGDVRFQKKCMDQMRGVSQSGRTIIFVSHNMGAVSRLCSRAILLDEGRVVMDGPADTVIGAYLAGDDGAASSREWPDIKSAPGNDLVRLRAIRVEDADGRAAANIDIRRPVAVEIEYDVLKPGEPFTVAIGLRNEAGIHVCTLGDRYSDWYERPRPVGRYTSRATIPGNLLAEGLFFVSVVLATDQSVKPINHVVERDVVAFQVTDPLEGGSARGKYAGKLPGVVRPMVPWETKMTPAKDDRFETEMVREA